MKTGYRILIQSDLDENSKKIAIEYCNDFFNKVGSQCSFKNAGYRRKTGGGHCSWFKRNTLGHVFDKNKSLVFRRISKNKRIFGVVKLQELVLKENKQEIDITKSCNCPYCTDFRVEFKNNIPEMDFYFEFGEISG